MKNLKLLSSVACAALLATTMPADATKVTTQTSYNVPDVENVEEINFSAFDINNDGVYTMAEVGDRLFDSFDLNGDQLIDNTEWDNKAILTITPIEKETFQYVDYDEDGMAEEATYSYETFYKASGLMRFDNNQDGLSAEEFINTGFQSLDNDNNLINEDEWKDAYLETRPPHEQPTNYN